MDWSLIDPELGSILGGRVSLGLPRVRKPKEEPVDYIGGDEGEKTLVGNLRDSTLTTLGAVGNALDLPGSTVRDVLALRNPFDQWLSPFSDKNRTSGRDLARKWGIAKKRDTYANFGGGILTEIATDPLTYMTFGASALSKAGKAAKAAGLMDDLSRVAASKAGKAIGEVGPRQARLSTTLDDFITHGVNKETRDKARDLIDQGFDPKESLGGLVGYGAPFSDPSSLGNFGKHGDRIAKVMDDTARLIRFWKVPGTENFRPVNDFLNLFDAPARSTTTNIGQEVMRQHVRNQEKASAAAKLKTNEWINDLNAAGIKGEDASDRIRMAVEGVTPIGQLHPVEQKIVGEMRDMYDATLATTRQEGGRLRDLKDDEIDYAKRLLTETLGYKPSKVDRIISGEDMNNLKRVDFLRNVPGGTVSLKEMFKDPILNDIIDNGGTAKDVYKYIRDNNKSWLPDTYKKYSPKDPKAVDGWVTRKGRYKTIAKWFHELSPETRRSGVFGNHVISDTDAYMMSAADAMQGRRTLADALSMPGVLGSGDSKTGVRLGDLVKNSKLTWNFFDASGAPTGEGFESFLKSKLGTSQYANMNLKDLKNVRISPELAGDLQRINKMISGPEEISRIVKFIDSTMNLTKGMLTGVWPAFHVRNFTSGMIHNGLLGMYDLESANAAKNLFTGGVIKDASKIPAIKAEWARRSGGSVLDDRSATRILGEMMNANGVVSKFDGRSNQLAGASPSAGTGNYDEILAGIPQPGVESFNLKRAGRKYVGREPGTNLNPMKSRGVGDRVQSEFGPAAAGEEVGYFTEGVIRGTAYINLLKKGYDPAEAAKKVGAAHTIYNNKNFTNFENQVMTRLFPFYKFTRNSVPFIAKNLMERPGGPYAQVVRASNAAQQQGEIAPDYVRDSASIPVDSKNPILSAVFGTPPEGTDRYISGLGMVHEDALSFGPSIRNTGLEILSRMNPLVKGPLEYATGETFFQRGPDGGQELDKLDPNVGRLISNLGNMTGLYTGDKPARLPLLLEQVASNSPVSRILSTARQITDRRKQSDYGILPFKVPGPSALSNVLTGVRVTDVSEPAKQAIVQDMLNADMKRAGGKAFERIRFTKTDMEQMSPEERLSALRSNAYANLLAKRTKERAKARKEKEDESKRKRGTIDSRLP